MSRCTECAAAAIGVRPRQAGCDVTACESCGRTFDDPDLACVWLDVPTCSTCCGCDDDEPTTPPTAALDRLRTAVLTDLALETTT